MVLAGVEFWFDNYYLWPWQAKSRPKMYRISEVLRLIGAVFETASVVQTVNKDSLYGHLVPI